MINPKFENYIVKFLSNQASSFELDALESWVFESQENEKVFLSFIKTNYTIDFNLKNFNKKKVKLKLEDIIKKEQKTIRINRIRKVIQYSAAAVFTGFLITSIVFKDKFFGTTKIESEQVIVKDNEISPGENKAILTLDDGSSIELDKESSFQTKQINSNGEKITYKPTTNKKAEIAYNYLTIPRGGQFYLKLADGTSVWLNSESQLKYPVDFIDGKERKVELIYGEAYFDVSPSTKHNGSKFIVSNQFQDIEVIGTEFNIQAYRDEVNIYTTLIEGKVSVNIGDIHKNLVPREQSNLNTKNNVLLVSEADIKSVIAWKNGLFSFRAKPLKDIAKVLSRWYDVDIIFENKDLETLKFKGSLEKNQSIEEILSIMKSNTINNYQIMDNKTIIIN